MQNKGEGVGAGHRVRGRKKCRKKGIVFGGWWKEQGRLEESEKGGGVGVCRCVLRGEWGGPMPFLLDRLNWFSIVIIDLFDLGITIPSLVAALGGILPPGCGAPSPARCLTLV